MILIGFKNHDTSFNIIEQFIKSIKDTFFWFTFMQIVMHQFACIPGCSRQWHNHVKHRGLISTYIISTSMSSPTSQSINRPSLPEIAATLPPVHPCRSDAPGTAVNSRRSQSQSACATSVPLMSSAPAEPSASQCVVFPSPCGDVGLMKLYRSDGKISTNTVRLLVN